MDQPELEKTQPETQARQGRSYKTSPLPVFKNDRQEPDRETILLSLYAEICSSWRMLTDVRFKLLGFVPTVSVAALIALLSRSVPHRARLSDLVWSVHHPRPVDLRPAQ